MSSLHLLSFSCSLSLASPLCSLSVVSGIFQKDVPQISRTSFWVTIKLIHQTYKTCREVTFFFLHIQRSEPSCRDKQQQHQPVPTTGIMYALIIIPIQSSNLFGLSGEQQFQRKNHEEWLVDKARKLSQIIQFSSLFFPLISLTHENTNTYSTCTHHSAFPLQAVTIYN